jgi:hypothetical protein
MPVNAAAGAFFCPVARQSSTGDVGSIILQPRSLREAGQLGHNVQPAAATATAAAAAAAST